MRQTNQFRILSITLPLTDTEFKQIATGFTNSIYRKRTDYIRNILFEKPVTIYTRSRTFDEFVAEIILLRNELNVIGNDFNVLVKKLYDMEDKPGIKEWIISNERSKELFFQKIRELQLAVNKILDYGLSHPL